MSAAYLPMEEVIFNRINLSPDLSPADTGGPESTPDPLPVLYLESLVSRTQRGEGEAFSTIYREYAERIFRYIYLRVRQAEQAEDLTQEVFLKALRSIHSYHYEGKSFINWLYRIAHNLIIDYYRQTNNRFLVPLDETIMTGEDPADRVEQMLGMSAIKKEVEKLPPRQREVISLRFESELSVAETALYAGITEGSVKKLQHEAILKLKSRMSMNESPSPSIISGLFLDYDGTISPLNIPRQQSRISPRLEEQLYSIRSAIPIGIVTAKDLSFIMPRTPFAHAWGAIAGLEIRTSSQSVTSRNVKKALPALVQALTYASLNISRGMVIEEKCDHQQNPLAFCIDWRQAGDISEARIAADRILGYCRKLRLNTIEYPGKPYFDVFPCSISKGRALRKLKSSLKIFGGVLYMGDSVADNPAFKEADISIGVVEDRKPADLDCRYWIKFEEVAFFLKALNANHLTFSPDLPGIRLNT